MNQPALGRAEIKQSTCGWKEGMFCELQFPSHFHLLLSLLLLSRSVMSDSFVTPWTVAHQASLSMGFSRQEYWNTLLFPVLQGIVPAQESNLRWQADSLSLSHQGGHTLALLAFRVDSVDPVLRTLGFATLLHMLKWSFKFTQSLIFHLLNLNLS